MRNENMIETVRKKFERLAGVPDERGRRVWATVEAEAVIGIGSAYWTDDQRGSGKHAPLDLS